MFVTCGREGSPRQAQCGVPCAGQPGEHAAAEGADVVGEVPGEELGHAGEVAPVGQVPVQADDVLDDKRRPRSDAQRNRARLITAARELVAEVGSEVALDEVAPRAGLGNATNLVRDHRDQ
jgi:hypothetical protein